MTSYIMYYVIMYRLSSNYKGKRTNTNTAMMEGAKEITCNCNLCVSLHTEGGGKGMQVTVTGGGVVDRRQVSRYIASN